MDQGASLVLFSPPGEYRAVGIQIAGLTDGHWRRYSPRDIVFERDTGAAFSVTAEFDAPRDRVTLSWPAIVTIEEPIPVSNVVVLVRTSLLDAADGGGGDGAVPGAQGMP